MQSEVLPCAQAIPGMAWRHSHCTLVSEQGWLNNMVVTTHQTLVAWSATVVA